MNDTQYPKTQGLFNLIVLKNPKNYKPKDLTAYKGFLIKTSAHRYGFKPNGKLKKHATSSKCKLIEALFDENLPKSSSIRRSTQVTYKKAILNRKSSPVISTPKKLAGYEPFQNCTSCYMNRQYLLE